MFFSWYWHTNGLVQERRNSSALAMELRPSCMNPSIPCVYPQNSRHLEAVAISEICLKLILTLKRLGHFFQTVISFFDAVHLMCNSFIWNWFNTMNVWSALWILMAWCFSTRASVAIVLTTHPCVSRRLRVKTQIWWNFVCPWHLFKLSFYVLESAALPVIRHPYSIQFNNLEFL